MASSNIQFEEIDQASELQSDMARILEFSHQEFFKTMVFVLRALMETIDNMQEDTDKVSREI